MNEGLRNSRRPEIEQKKTCNLVFKTVLTVNQSAWLYTQNFCSEKGKYIGKNQGK